MNERPGPAAPATFEARLTAAFTGYADRAPIDVDAVTLTALVASGEASRDRGPLAGGHRYLVSVLIGLLLIGLVAGAALVGARMLERRPDAETPEQPAVVGPSIAPSTDGQAAPTTSPSSDARPAGSEPCPAMVQRYRYWSDPDPTGSMTDVGTAAGNGDILYTTVAEGGVIGIGRLDPSTSPPAPAADPGTLHPYVANVVVDPRTRIVPSPDGRAVAFEVGDLDVAGCGDPIILPDTARPTWQIRRPFPGRAFELVSDVAWAPDGSALYAIRRPTLDANGDPYVGEDGPLDGPGTVLRWDTRTGQVSELPPGCEDCSRIVVSPDGTRLAAHGADVIRIYDSGTGWRDLTPGTALLGWADDASVVVYWQDAGHRVLLDGTIVTEWGHCCFGTGYGGRLSPDGTTIASTTLSSDSLLWQVTLLDVRDGSTRVVWRTPNADACTAFDEGSTERAACLAEPHPTPGPPGSLSADTPARSPRIVAWSPDGRDVLLMDLTGGPTSAMLEVVPVDGSGAGQKATITVPFMIDPEVGPSISIAWLPATAP